MTGRQALIRRVSRKSSFSVPLRSCSVRISCVLMSAWRCELLWCARCI